MTGNILALRGEALAPNDPAACRLPVTAFGKLVAAPHDKLEPVAFATLIAASVYAACVCNNFQVPSASLSASAAVGVEEVGVMCRYALHDWNISKERAGSNEQVVGDDRKYARALSKRLSW